jgi:hypothetical protein
MNSAAARSKRSRSAGGWPAVGSAARSATARMRTPRLESDSSGETRGQICAAGALSSMSRAPIRTIGSGSARPVLVRLMFDDDTRDASSVSALARANAEVLRSDATAESSAAASVWPAQAA